MFSPDRLRTFAILGALAGTMLASSTAAAAQPSAGTQCRMVIPSGLLVTVPCPDTRHKSAPHAPSAEGTQLNAARAQERYYTSYGEPAPIAAPLAPAPADDTPWLTIALAAAVALAAASIAAIHRRRLRLRRRLARAAT